MPGAKSFPPELRRRNRITLLTLLGVVAIFAAIPVVDRLLTKPIPVVNQTARDLFPPKAAGTPLLTLYAPPEADLTAAVATMLDRYEPAAQAVFPEPPQPIEIALLPDPVETKQVWIQIFSTDDRKPGQRGVGRSTFVLYDAQPSEGVTTQQQAGEVAQLIGRALLEQKLEERLRLVSEPYVWLVADMMAVALMPELEDEAWAEYIAARETHEPLSERAWLGGFVGTGPSPLVRATTRLLAAQFLRSRRSTEFIPLIRDGYDLETAFRAMASGLLTGGGQREDAPPESIPGTSFDAMIQRLEQQMQARAASKADG